MALRDNTRIKAVVAIILMAVFVLWLAYNSTRYGRLPSQLRHEIIILAASMDHGITLADFNRQIVIYEAARAECEKQISAIQKERLDHLSRTLDICKSVWKHDTPSQIRIALQSPSDIAHAILDDAPLPPDKGSLWSSKKQIEFLTSEISDELYRAKKWIEPERFENLRAMVNQMERPARQEFSFTSSEIAAAERLLNNLRDLNKQHGDQR